MTVTLNPSLELAIKQIAEEEFKGRLFSPRVINSSGWPVLISFYCFQPRDKDITVDSRKDFDVYLIETGVDTVCAWWRTRNLTFKREERTWQDTLSGKTVATPYPDGEELERIADRIQKLLESDS